MPVQLAHGPTRTAGRLTWPAVHVPGSDSMPLQQIHRKRYHRTRDCDIAAWLALVRIRMRTHTRTWTTAAAAAART